MPNNTITLEQLKARGAGERELRYLRQIYEGDVVTIETSRLESLSIINVFWWMALLSKADQKELILHWYDTCLASQMVDWKAEVRAYLTVVTVEDANTKVTEFLAAKTEAVEGESELGRVLSGLGYAFCTLAKEYTLKPAGHPDINAAITPYIHWVVACLAHLQQRDQDLVRVDIRSAILAKIEQDGIATVA